MIGRDVGYAWPLLEGVVVTQLSRPPDSWRSVMGNPNEAATTSGETSSQQTPPLILPPPPQPTTITPTVEPPPYEIVTTQAPEQITSSVIINPPSVNNRHAQRSALRTRTNNVASPQRLRLPRWPHKASSVFACLSCVIGVCNVSRFSMLVYVYKGCFIFQFLFLSILFGIPAFYLQMVLGQYLGAGMLDMWYISPAFKGLGFAMLYLYILLGVYNAIPLSWLFIYFKDSFITLKDSYKWGRCHYSFARNGCVRALNTSSADFYGWSVPSYFHGRVLGRKPGEYLIGELKFEVAFNLCLVWIIVFLCLSRGPKTFGKVVYVFGMLPVALLLMVAMRMGQQWGDGIMEIFASPWKPVLLALEY